MKHCSAADMPHPQIIFSTHSRTWLFGTGASKNYILFIHFSLLKNETNNNPTKTGTHIANAAHVKITVP